MKAELHVLRAGGMDTHSTPSARAPEPPVSWPATHLSADEILRRAHTPPAGSSSASAGLNGLRRILACLATFPGHTWQARWIASGCDDAGTQWDEVLDDTWSGLTERGRYCQSTGGLAMMLCLDVIRPGYLFLHDVRPINATQFARQVRDPAFIREATNYGQGQNLSDRAIDDGLLVLSKIMLHTGRVAADITPDDVLDYRRVTHDARGRSDGTEFAWDLLVRFGGFPQGTATLRDVLRRGPLSTADLVASYHLQCRPVRELLVRYLNERAATLDYTSLRGLASVLAKTFWKDLELHHPGLHTLDLSADVAAEWKKRVHARFKDPWSILIAVRALYLDMAHWAMDDPYWVAWAVRSPVTAADTRGVAKHKKRTKAKMHQRIRSLAPHFPSLVRGAHDQYEFEAGLLAAARQTEPGATLNYRGSAYERVAVTVPDRGGADSEGRPIWLREPGGRKRTNQEGYSRLTN